MKRLIIIVFLMTAHISHAMDNHPKRAMLCLPSNNNHNMAFEDQDDQDDEPAAKKYKCDHPDCIDRRPFAGSSGLNAHKLIHKSTIEKQRPYPCRIDGCTARFTQVGSRKSHEDSFFHTGVKSHACSFENCGRSFARNSDLIKHENFDHLRIIENGNICPECGRIITRTQNMPAHMRTHTGEKPYQCECTKRFARSDVLKAHQRTCPQHLAILSAAQQMPQINGNTIIGLAQPPQQLSALSLKVILNNDHNNDNATHDDDAAEIIYDDDDEKPLHPASILLALKGALASNVH